MIIFRGFVERKGQTPPNEKTGEVRDFHYYDLSFDTDEVPGVHGMLGVRIRGSGDLIINGAADLDSLINKEVYPISDLNGYKDADGKIKQVIIRLVAVG